MPDKPCFSVAVVGLDPHDLRLIAIVFRHIRHNRFLFRLCAPHEAGRADVLIAAVGDEAGRAALARARARRPVPMAAIGVVRPGEGQVTRHAVEFPQLVRQLLPILNRVVEIEGLAPGGRPRPVADAESAARPRVLVVEGDPSVRAQLGGAFERFGLSCDIAVDSVEAMARLSAAPVDLAMVDVALPDGDGLSLARRIRREHRWRDLPIVVLGHRRAPLDVVRSAVAGCSAYLARPIAFDDLHRTVSRQLGRTLPAERLPPRMRWAAAHAR
jgi:CheY-like chemotaxis protein